MTGARADRGVEGMLADVRVLEWGQGIAVSYAGRLLADLGAQVTCITPPWSMGAAPHHDGEVAAFLARAKKNLRLDVTSREGRAAFLDQVDSADLLIEDSAPRQRARVQLEPAVVERRNPRLVQVSVTPFGRSGPYKDFRAGDLEIAYLSGLAYLTPRDVTAGDAGACPPLKMPGSLVSIYAGASTAGAALTALYGREDGQRCRSVEVSMLECLIPTLRREIALFQYERQVASRFMRVWRLAPWGVKRCSDGYVFLQVVERHHWQGLVEMMGEPDWARDSSYLDPNFRFEHRLDIEERMAPWLLTQAKAQFAWEAQRRGLPFAPVNEPADVLHVPQLHFRRFFRAASTPDGRPCVVPGTPFVLAPGRTGAEDRANGKTQERATRSKRSGPLCNLRVIDFGHVWAGPYCAALLADMGAEVIKVESAHRLDIHRRQGPYSEHRPGVNRSGVWNSQNRGKRSVTFNLSTERGRELAKALVATADVVVENFAPGVMTRLGLDYQSLRAVRPSLVMASLSAFGQEGPQRRYVGYGPSLDAWAGLDALTAYADGEPNALGGIFPDTGSALHAASAILAALHCRNRTGVGRYIDVSELEVSVLLVSDVVSRALNGSTVRASGNSDGIHFPQGGYRCVGADRWIALTVVDDASWTGLCTVLGRSEWARAQRFATPEARKAAQSEIDAAIAAWSASQTSETAMLALQRHGVPAGAANDAQLLLDDPHLAARGFFATLVHPEVGAHPVYGPIWRVDGASPQFDTPAPTLGADNQYVLGSVLGLPAAEIEALISARVVY